MVFSYLSFPNLFLGVGLIGLGVFIFCILPILLGLMALRQIDRSGGAQRGRGLALCAIVLGALGLLVTPVLFLAAGTVRVSSSRSYSATSGTIHVPGVTIQTSTSGGQGGLGGQGSFGNNGSAGGNGSVLPVPLPPRINSTPQPNTSRNTGSVGEMSLEDDFGADPAPAVSRPPTAKHSILPAQPPSTTSSTVTAPKAVPAPATPQASKRKSSGSVGEQDIDN